QIRVVDLLPGSGLDPITLECRIITLNGGRSFEALSYVWGDLLSPRTVKISGYNVEITQPLHVAFQNLRDSDETRTLWVDQVCINQLDDIEKSHQVSLMRTIYRKCTQCVIWLGEIPSDRQFSTVDAKVAMDFIHIMAYDKSYLTKVHTFVTHDGAGKRARKAFEALIMGGNPCLSKFPAVRDVSYSITPATLFARVTLDLIRIDKDLRSLLGARELQHITPDLPTWAVDFASSSAIGKRQTKWWQHSHRYLRWTASKGLNFRLEASKDDKTLSLSGILIDRVQKVGEVYHVKIEDEIDDERVRETIVQSRRILEEYQASCSSDLEGDYVSGGTLNDAFWRTVLGNLIMAELPKGVPKYYHKDDFDAYVEKGTHSRLTLSLHGLVPNHVFFITTKGYIGMGSPDVQEGDEVHIFGGGRVPFVIRPQNISFLEGSDTKSRRYHLVCDVYVHGIMRGEAV
ncbi:hypothetical protein CC86DRAFT_272032, partial [Ophiobolus disseminans]